jgi:hypothetical protein
MVSANRLQWAVRADVAVPYITETLACVLAARRRSVGSGSGLGGIRLQSTQR